MNRDAVGNTANPRTFVFSQAPLSFMAGKEFPQFLLPLAFRVYPRIDAFMANIRKPTLPMLEPASDLFRRPVVATQLVYYKLSQSKMPVEQAKALAPP